MKFDLKSSPGERPLSRGGSAALATAAGATILLFYLFGAASVLFLLVLVACEFVLLIALLRFGLAGFIGRVLGHHMALLPLVVRSFWLGKGSEFRIALKPEAAPRLFEKLGALCQKAGVAMPKEVLLEMSLNAWVRLAGYRRGAGKTTLGIGYDLLAGLTELELEAVLAHEMTHARLVQRGLNKWLQRGLNRAARLAGALATLVDAGRNSKKDLYVAKALLRPADWLTRTCARFVAACSRQDEFAADRGAAELCSGNALGSALVTLERIARVAARLTWRERVAQLQLGGGFSQWLVSELTANHSEPAPEVQSLPFNKYGTHPSLADRLTALGYTHEATASTSTPAIDMLLERDRLAEQLIAEIQRVVALQELKDSRQLNRWSRKIRSHSHLHPLQSLGLLLALVGLVFGLAYWATIGMSIGVLLFIAATGVPGVLCYRFCSVKEKLALPLPDFLTLKRAFHTKLEHDDAKIKALETELSAQAAAGKKKQRVLVLGQTAYQALGQCDYLRAHVAARLCLRLDKNSIEAMLAFAVAAAAFRQARQVDAAFAALRKRTQITRGSPAWGTAWALLLMGNWSQSEAFLHLARKGRSNEPTLLALQAMCQANRGKLQSAIVSARQACTPKPPNVEFAKLLVSLLLDGGLVREAEGHLGELEAHADSDPDVMLLMVRVRLMLRDGATAERWAARFKSTFPKPQKLLHLGGIYESFRQHEHAAQCYQDAQQTGHYPEACLGLGRLEAARSNKDRARVHFLAALDFDRQPGAESCGAFPVLHPTLQQLSLLREPVGCTGWTATINNVGPRWLANKSLLVYAPDRAHAEQLLREIVQAMQPGCSAGSLDTISWRQAPQEHQPFGLVRPGVQRIMS